MESEMTVSETDLFKGVYKRFKRRDRPLNTSGVIDFHTVEENGDPQIIPFNLIQPSCEKFPGLKPFKDWKAYQLRDSEGFIVIRNPFEPKYQRYWIKRCLLDFPTKPNRTNIDAHMQRPSHIWQMCTVDGKRPDLQKDSLLMKLRWATLGYQYEWNTKEYFADRVQSFPDDLSHLCSYIAQTLDFSNYSSEAGIVNYYRMDSSLMGHTDVSELDKAAPLISFSFGQSCIFLIGGPTKATEPTALFLHSGDVCLMTGKARLSYHAVPRILHANREELLHCFYGDTDASELNKGQTCEGNVINTNNEVHPINGSGENGIKSETNDETLNDYDDTYSAKGHIDVEDSENDDPYGSKGETNVEKIKSKDLGTDLDNEPVIITPTACGNRCSVEELSRLMETVIEETDWSGFQKYLDMSRVNVNVRQVLKEGLELGLAPEVIKPCQKNCSK